MGGETTYSEQIITNIKNSKGFNEDTDRQRRDGLIVRNQHLIRFFNTYISTGLCTKEKERLIQR